MQHRPRAAASDSCYITPPRPHPAHTHGRQACASRTDPEAPWEGAVGAEWNTTDHGAAAGLPKVSPGPACNFELGKFVSEEAVRGSVAPGTDYRVWGWQQLLDTP